MTDDRLRTCVTLVCVAIALLGAVHHGIGRGAAQGDATSFEAHVPCASSGPACGAALQRAIEDAPAGATITLDAGRVYEGTFSFPMKAGAAADKPLTITTRGWTSKGHGWDGLVTPADKPRMAVLRGTRAAPSVVEVMGRGTGFVRLIGLAFEATPTGRGDLIRVGSGRETSADDLPRHVTLREILLQGDREFGQKRAVAANGVDIEIDRVWCEEIFTPGQDSQCVAAWNGGHRVTIRHSYLAAGAENILVGGAPVASAAMQPSEWTIEDVILHKPLRWQHDGRNRAVKNLLEFKHGRQLTVRRVLAVNNWRAAQSGRGLLLHYTTNGPCRDCGNLEEVHIEDLVMLNVAGGISLQGYSWQKDSHSAGHLREVTLRNLFVQISGPERLLEISNVHGRHNIRIERSTFLNGGSSWLLGDFGMAWTDDETRVEGGAMQGLTITNNVIAANGTYGITAPQGKHYGTGIGAFVDADLQIAGNIIGDAPPEHLANYNAHRATGPANASGPAGLREKFSASTCMVIRPDIGADCARLRPVFALMRRLPEP